MQFAENFHQSKPEPVQFARAARLIMAEDPSLTAAEVSRIVGAPAGVDAQGAAAARAARGDRRARRARRPLVHRRRLRAPRHRARRRHAEQAENLVEEHANGALCGIELKYGVGYVPPPPENYEEVSDRLDAARRAAEPGRRARSATTRRSDDRARRPSEPAPAPHDGLSDADLDGFVLGAFLLPLGHRRARRKLLRITGEADAHEYARSLHPHERLAALRSFAREVIEEG